MRERYFEWLIKQVSPGDGTDAFRNHTELFRVLFEKKFYSLVPHDENRGDDGLVLRREFAQENKINQIDLIMPEEASVFEVLVALARRMTLTMDGFVKWNEPCRWMYEMLDNLRLIRCDNRALSDERDRLYLVDDILEEWLSRSYSFSGFGGLFPIAGSEEDQRDIEIWEQCQHYLFELYQKDILR